MDRHLNIFHAYRQGSTADAERESVLEDNVTRALIITLGSSAELTQAFLKEFTGVNTDGKYNHGLQGRPESDKAEAGKRKSLPGRCLIVIAGRPEIPKSLQVPDEVLDKLESQTKDSLKTIPNALKRLSNQVQEGTIGEEGVGRELIRLFALNDTEAAAADLNDSALPFYLYQLTLGSRPDAWITCDQFSAVFENKLQGRISDAQIRRHIRKSFGDGLQPTYFLRKRFDKTGQHQVPVVLWPWRDVYSFFNRFRDEQLSTLDPKSKTDYVVSHFLDYLEGIGMGEVKFTTQDFLEWESSTEKTVVDKLFPHVKALGDELSQELKQIGAHESHPQKSQDDYLGVNLMRKTDLDQEKTPAQVPHFSCALSGRVLTLFITCESKELVEKLVEKRNGLEGKMADALWKVQSHGLPGLRLEIHEKLHLVFGGAWEKRNCSE